MSLIGDLIGAFGGKKQRSPTRTPDTLLSDDYLEIILGISEGPIKGLVPGDREDRPVQNFFIDKTPLQNAATGTSNFDSFSADFYNGEETDGTIQPKLGGTSSNMTVGVRLAQNVDVIRQTPPSMRGKINYLEFRILFNQLMKQNDQGTFETEAKFTIAYKLSTSSTWSYYQGEGVTTVFGKTTNGYARDFIIPVPLQSTADYDLRVTKMSPDNGTIDFVELTWESLQMVTLGAKAYPYLAMAHLYGKASNQFTNIPEFSGIYDGLCDLKIPTNYNPDTRTYDESTPWNGTFKVGYTNNPAWCLYALITNPRYGLAKYYKNVAANRYEFYEAAKWCDEMVSDGQGGLQPRFTYNDLITDLRPGLEAIRNLAGSFNAVVYDDGNGTIRIKTDKYQDPQILFTPENVSKEGFSYTFTDITTRVNDVNVSFCNPDMDWGDDRRAATIDTSEWKEANGIVPEEFTAVGCTDVHEALRRANYRILTANTEFTNVLFLTSRLGAIGELYDIIYVADPDAGWSTGGRIKSVLGSTIYLRDPIYFSEISSVKLKVQTYTGLTEVTVAPAAAGAVYTLQITGGALPEDLPDRTVFTAENLSTMGIAKPFRIISIESAEGIPDSYQITAVEVNINKYRDADANTISVPVTYSFRKPGVPLQPYNLTASSGTKYLLVGADGTIIPRLYVSWVRPLRSYTDHYEVDYQESGSGNWITKEVYTDSYLIEGVTAGASYDIHVTPVSILGVRGTPAKLDGYVIIGKEEPPPNVTGLILTRDGVAWDEMSLEEVPDLRGYLLRFHYGENYDWGTAQKLHVGFLTDSPYNPPFRLTGPLTVLAKALDTSGHESLEAAGAYGDMGEMIAPNIVQSFDFDPTFPGTKLNCTVVSDELVASSLDKFYGPDKAPFYGPSAEAFFEATLAFSQMVYTTEAITINKVVRGSVTHLDLIADGESVTVEYREFSSVPFYGLDADPFYGTAGGPFYEVLPQQWKTWKGSTELRNGTYQWRVTINSTSVRGKISLMHIAVDAPDRMEFLNDVVIAAGGTVIPYTLKDLTAIRAVQATPNANGVGSIRVEVDKTNPLAPVIFAYNSSNVSVGGATADITLTGY